MREALFASFSPEFVDSEEGRAALEDVTWNRFDECRRVIVPWIEGVRSLAGLHVAEIGCGAGSSTAAIAERAKAVVGVDIDAVAVRAAQLRCDILGLSGVQLVCCAPQEVMPRLRAAFPSGADVVLLYAVLEHQTVEERLAGLRESWLLLRPGGLLVVTDTPNRLTYMDLHTSLLPFFHMLPAELAIAYADRSPRANFRTDPRFRPPTSPEVQSDALARWGRGVSYHEFEMALGDLAPLVVADGYHPLILSIKPEVQEEVLLRQFAHARGLTIPEGFWRQSLDLILRKPG
jgi:S-adenosylmethionine-dependent methyltransferase